MAKRGHNISSWVLEYIDDQREQQTKDVFQHKKRNFLFFAQPFMITLCRNVIKKSLGLVLICCLLCSICQKLLPKLKVLNLSHNNIQSTEDDESHSLQVSIVVFPKISIHVYLSPEHSFVIVQVNALSNNFSTELT